jgi:hypothetical protein
MDARSTAWQTACWRYRTIRRNTSRSAPSMMLRDVSGIATTLRATGRVACAGAKTLFLLESVAELEVYNVPLPPTDGLAQQRHAKQRRASQTKPNQTKANQTPNETPDKQAESPDMHRERGEHANAEITRGCTSARARRALRMLPRQSACGLHDAWHVVRCLYDLR